MFASLDKAFSTLLLVALCLYSVNGSFIRKVVYDEGVADTEETASSFWQGNPPIEQWLEGDSETSFDPPSSQGDLPIPPKSEFTEGDLQMSIDTNVQVSVSNIPLAIFNISPVEAEREDEFRNFGFFDYYTTHNDPPPHDQVAKMARYIVRNSDWASVSTISTLPSLEGYPFVNVFSVSDGLVSNSSGIPYMYLTPLDMSAKDLTENSRASMTMSLVQTDYCEQQKYDPEDPRCAKVILSGNVVKITDEEEVRFARQAVFSRHPEMQKWPKDHGWFFAKLDLAHIIVLDYFGGAKSVPLDAYFQQSFK